SQLRSEDAARRSSTPYGPEDDLKLDKTEEEEHLQDDGLSLDGQDGEFLFNDDEDPKDRFSCQNSPLSNGTNPDAGYASPLSTTSDQLVDLKTTTSTFSDQDRIEEKLEDGSESINSLSLQDSLAKMKAVYANMISDGSWSSIALDVFKSKQANNFTATNGSGSDHKGSNGTSTRMASSHSSNGINVSSSGTGGLTYDWHQAALAKTLQHTPYQLLPEPSLFSTVQLYRQNNKLYGPVFTGASKFRCKDCSAAYDTLVGLTVHMNETGHYRDDNKDSEDDRSKKWSKPRKRSLLEMEGKEDAQKVLKCMYCGHSFESLQDLSVHMIKTKHYQKVPLKEPMPALTSKLVPPSKKKVFQELISPSSPESVSSGILLGESPKDQKVVNPYVTPNNRYGYQNGASYTWQFEARKAQILKCMECGSSHDTLQQLTAHMMVTGHFLKVTNSASKKGKQLVFDPLIEEKIQSIPLPPTTARLPAADGLSPLNSLSQLSGHEEKHEEIRQEEKEQKKYGVEHTEKKIKEEKEDLSEKTEKPVKARSYQYLREEDLEETPKGGLDILKSLENTVSSAISKAQTGTPTWGGYPSIHAAYQLHGSLKPTLPSSPQVQPLFSSTSLKVRSTDTSSLIHSPHSPSPPPSQKSNVVAMEELVEKVTGRSSVKTEKEEKSLENKCRSSKSPLPSPKDKQVSPNPENLLKTVKGSVGEQTEPKDKEKSKTKIDVKIKRESDSPKATMSNGCNNLNIITNRMPEPPLVSPLSALQSVMNNHLGKASKAVTSSMDPFAMLYKMSNTPQSKQTEPISQYPDNDDDQPMDLTKSKSGNRTTAKLSSTAPNNFNKKNALMDISDMVKNLTGRLTPKSTTPSSVSEKSDNDGCSLEDSMEELSPVQRRKGRQSNWNPQHLLILQAQFASTLRETPEGKFVINDLGPQERVHICKFTGLSMTTISHWLANVKYQLKRTGGTKFLKNIDSAQPLFLCSDCASQFRSPSSYIHHLESHLGFTLQDLSKLSIDLLEQQAVSRLEDKTFDSSGNADEDASSVYQCKLCNRTFVSKHAIKLHLCKTHGKSTEDHLIFVKELDK
uniref:C2H2-type domain-containing protein n=1 Tax=Oryzias latipes TaxID=8090 RepID=H2LDL2_ORYLA